MSAALFCLQLLRHRSLAGWKTEKRQANPQINYNMHRCVLIRRTCVCVCVNIRIWDCVRVQCFMVHVINSMQLFFWFNMRGGENMGLLFLTFLSLLKEEKIPELALSPAIDLSQVHIAIFGCARQKITTMRQRGFKPVVLHHIVRQVQGWRYQAYDIILTVQVIWNHTVWLLLWPTSTNQPVEMQYEMM